MKQSWQSRLINFFLKFRRIKLTQFSHIEAMRNGEVQMERFLRKKLNIIEPQLNEVSLRGITTLLSRCAVTANNEQKTSLSDRKALLLLHGGAYIAHPKPVYKLLLADLSKQMKVDGFLPDYRLAPENPHPAGIDDCYTSYLALLEMGYQAENIVLFGDSAGGGLAMSVLQKALKNNTPVPACAILSSPAGDWSLQGKSFYENEGCDPMFKVVSMLFLRDIYLNGHSATDPDVSPVYGQFEGLPPLFICTSSTELMRDMAVTINEKAKAAGVETVFNMADKLMHDYAIMGFLPESKIIKAQMIAFCEQHLNKA